MAGKNLSRRDFIFKSSVTAISVGAAAGPLAQVFGATEPDIKQRIDLALRITKPENLLSLEFYFINVSYRGGCILHKPGVFSRFGPQTSYMVVRLPQQHITEQSFDTSNTGGGPCSFSETDAPLNWLAQTCISGYSYLVFSLVNDPRKGKIEIRANEAELMDWNNPDRFRLVLRQNLQESLFNLTFRHFAQSVDRRSGHFYENTYPLSYKNADGKLAYDRARFPTVYGDPVTAIEAPWRLLISPKEPSIRKKLHWEFTDDTALKNGAWQLWVATLTSIDNPNFNPAIPVASDDRKLVYPEDPMRQLAIMIFGSPDHPYSAIKGDQWFEITSGKILPKAQDRFSLVQLYIEFHLLASADKLAFSPLGLSLFLDFKNKAVKQTSIRKDHPITLNSYKHLISFGRDEMVELTNLVVDKETGCKMLHIRTAKRRAKKGNAYLDYREYIKPLEIEKDYTAHEDGNGVTKFASPFKKIRFIEIAPKRICPLSVTGSNLTYTQRNSNLVQIDSYIEGIYYPQTPGQDASATSDLTFSVEITDWHDQVHTVDKKVQIVTYGVNKRLLLPPGPNHISLTEIETFFDDPADKNSMAGITTGYARINNDFTTLINRVKAGIETADPAFYSNVVAQLTELKALLPTNKLGEILNNRKNALLNFIVVQQNQFKRIIQDKIDGVKLDLTLILLFLQDQANALLAAKAAAKAELDAELIKLDAAIQQATQAVTDDINREREILAGLDEIYKQGRALKTKQGNLEKIKKEIVNEKDPVRLEELKKDLATVEKEIEAWTKHYWDLIERDGKLLADLGIALSRDIQKMIAAVNQKVEKIRLAVKWEKERIKTAGDKVRATFKNQIDTLEKAFEKTSAAYAAKKNQLDTFELNVSKQFRSDAYYTAVQVVEKWLVSFADKISAISREIVQAARKLPDGLFNAALTGRIDESMACMDDLLKTEINVNLKGLDGKSTNPVVTINLQTYLQEYLAGIAAEARLLLMTYSYAYLRPLKVFQSQLQSQIAEFQRQFIAVVHGLEALKENEKNIRNAIYTARSRIGYAVNQIASDVKEEINGSISALVTDFFVLKGQLKTTLDDEGKVMIDFFHPYTSIPQLQQAQVYITSLTRLTGQEVPVAINYANEYLKTQIDPFSLNVKDNISRAFAEVKELSKNEIRGLIREVSGTLGGIINPEIPVDTLTYLRDQRVLADNLIRQFPAEILEEARKIEEQTKRVQQEITVLRDQVRTALDSGIQNVRQLQLKLKAKGEEYIQLAQSSPIVKDLILISKEAKDLYKEAQSFSPDTFFKNLNARILGSISLSDILQVDFELPKLSQSGDTVTYNFITDKIKSKDFSFFKFVAGKKTDFQVYLNKKLGANDEHRAITRLRNFAVIITLSGQDILLMRFSEFSVTSGSNAPRKVKVGLDSVAFGGPLDFFAKLAEKLRLPGSGLRIRVSPARLDVGYGLPVPSISSPGFNFTNIKFDIGISIPFANGSEVKPMELVAGINTEQDKFLITVGIFGGRGFFQLRATPDQLQSVRAAIEFGGYFGINLGIASGYVFLFAGISLDYDRSGDITLVGYLICEGGVTVLGFISIYLTIRLAMTYQRIGGKAALYGSATMRYSVKIGFFRKSFQISFTKIISGSESNQNIENQQSTAQVRPVDTPVYYASTDVDPVNLALHASVPGMPEIFAPAAKAELNTDPRFGKVFSRDHWRTYYQSFCIN